ncbi:hypothetical protein CEXT_405101 [Caerostris extrusa]|uniref:Uncharacterized protein n=1 Tax=Caerostris extrusa TaxID=172846 RepID=A0AAV4V783_CAEEX|nr:hypothetical protein CEXT_405101 [Caerostris extrusa]
MPVARDTCDDAEFAIYVSLNSQMFPTQNALHPSILKGVPPFTAKYKVFLTMTLTRKAKPKASIPTMEFAIKIYDSIKGVEEKGTNHAG